jgi:hypothetical protein
MTPSINGQVNLIPTLSIPQIYLVSWHSLNESSCTIQKLSW